ncbi:MAG: UDP-N-acetylmuramate--L-alanine ligase [Clostridia bacterium]|nr:UDP-N-acetylmuramate--L-alanine ligase [Clostridia bacterium]
MALENTHFGYEGIREIMGDGPRSIFFLGIGGVSMNSLAQVCRMRGHTVAGYDRTESALTKRLEDEGVRVFYTASAENAAGCDLVVYTVAIPADDPVYVWAGNNGIPRISRADFLGYVMKRYGERIGISGMHGKSTTTAVVAEIFSAAGREPTVFGGAKMAATGETNVIGREDYFIFEACEYMDSFLDFYPTVSVVLNVEMDHVDYFKDMDQIKNSFAGFIRRGRSAVINGDCEDALEAARMSGRPFVTFGREGGEDYVAENVTPFPGGSEFDIVRRGVKLCRARINVPGDHIVTDAVAAAAVSIECGVSPEAVAEGLGSYKGIRRRMERVGETKSGAAVFDDYAHHPTEVAATLKTAAEFGFDRLIVVFQPHTFSRTFELFDGFADALAKTGADEVILMPIYPARETNVYGVTSDQLAEAVAGRGTPARCLHSFGEAADEIREKYGRGDCVITVGAGDVEKLAPMLVQG